MTVEVRMPQLGESVTEGTVVRWLKQPGDAVALDDSLAEIETEKVNVEIPSPFAGTVDQLLVGEGETVAVGVPIATLTEAGNAAALLAQLPVRPAAETAGEQAATTNTPPLSAGVFSATGPLAPAGLAHGMFSTGEHAAPANSSPATAPAKLPGGGGRFSPAVLRLAHESHVDLNVIAGTGAGGRITRKDVQAWIDANGSQATGVAVDTTSTPANQEQFVPAMPSPVEPPSGTEVQQVQDAFAAPGPVEAARAGAVSTETATAAVPPTEVGTDSTIEPLTATRKAIAVHMVRSVQTSPHAWMMVEVDVSQLVAYRQSVREEFNRREGIDLTYLPFMLKATANALRAHPRLNSSWSDAGVVLKHRINLGIAVDTGQGLVVPVILDADGLSVAGLARKAAELAARARARRLRLEDVQGGTFTVDNVGPIGSIVSQPIINQPQCAVLTMESIVKRPVVVDDAIAIRSIMNCCISFDHRIVDGGDIGPFMKAVRGDLESMGKDTPLY